MALFTKVYDELISRIQQSLLVYVPGLTTLSSRKFGNSLPMDACFLVLEPHFCCPIGLCKLHPINFGFSTLRRCSGQVLNFGFRPNQRSNLKSLGDVL